jgi:hypothetical protein
MPRSLPGEQPPTLQRRRELRRGAVIVHVITVAVSREHLAHDVMEVVGPDAVKSPSAARGILEHRGEVAVVFRIDERRRVGRLVNGGGELGDEVARASVDQRVRRVQPQSVGVVLVDPVQRVLNQQPSHDIAAGVIQVHGAAPGGLVLRGEKARTQLGQIGALGSEMVVDDVDEHGEAGIVSRVDQRPQVIGAAVRARGSKQRDAVIPPVAIAGEIGQRHQLDRGDPEIAQVGKLLDDAAEGTRRREGADVQFVDDGAARIEPAPTLVGPGEAEGVEDLGPLVHAVRLKAARRVGPGIPAIHDKGVSIAHVRGWRPQLPQAGILLSDRRPCRCQVENTDLTPGGAYVHLHRVRVRGPDLEVDAAGGGNRAKLRGVGSPLYAADTALA